MSPFVERRAVRRRLLREHAATIDRTNGERVLAVECATDGSLIAITTAAFCHRISGDWARTEWSDVLGLRWNPQSEVASLFVLAASGPSVQKVAGMADGTTLRLARQLAQSARILRTWRQLADGSELQLTAMRRPGSQAPLWHAIARHDGFRQSDGRRPNTAEVARLVADTERLELSVEPTSLSGRLRILIIS